MTSPFPANGSKTLVDAVLCSGTETDLADCNIDTIDYCTDDNIISGDNGYDLQTTAVSVVCSTPSGEPDLISLLCPTIELSVNFVFCASDLGNNICAVHVILHQVKPNAFLQCWGPMQR